MRNPETVSAIRGLVFFLVLGLLGCGGNSSPQNDVVAEISAEPSATVVFQASPSFGEAPLTTTLSWLIASDRPSELRCELDMDGDGIAEEVMEPCSVTGSRPWTYEERGEYSPSLMVRSSGGQIVARKDLRVFSNELVFVEEVLELDKEAWFLGFEAEGDVVTLLQDGSGPDEILAGTLLLSKHGAGLIARVISIVETNESEITVSTELAGLDELIKEGFWGVMADTSATAETGRAALRSNSKADLFNIDSELTTDPMSFSPQLPNVSAEGGGGSLALTDVVISGKAVAGINAFVLKKGVFTPTEFDISVWASAEWDLGATVVGGLAKSWRHELPELLLGVIPIGPVPITFSLEPALFGKVSLEGSLETGTDGYVYVMGGAQNLSGNVETYGDAEFDSNFTLEPAGAAVEGTAKAGLSFRLKIQIASMVGPFAEAGGYGKAVVSVDSDEYCIKALLGLEGAVGGEFEFLKVIDVELSYPFDFADWEIWSKCYPQDCQSDCSGLECGEDPICEQSCGKCGDGWECNGGTCECLSDCSGSECGPDPICGESCGTCPEGQKCVAGNCTCEPACAGKECGNDGCGGDCGECGPEEVCSGGACVTDCPQTCDSEGWECGEVCGKECGSCSNQDDCVKGTCVCQSECGGAECGDDGCGGNCGTCGDGFFCAGGQCSEVPITCGDEECNGDETKCSCADDCGVCQGCCEGIQCKAGTSMSFCGTDANNCAVCGGGESCLDGGCACVPNDHKECVDGDSYWYDSCGAKGELVEDCGNYACSGGTCQGADCGDGFCNGSETKCNCAADCDPCPGCCSGSICQAGTAANACGDDGAACEACNGGEVCSGNACICQSHEEQACSGGSIYWFDSCGGKEDKVQDCDDGDPCTQNACNGASCTYPPENDGAECAPDKVCKSGSCILACDDDFEPNNNCGAASSISQGNHTNLVMAYPNDDYYKINVGNGKTLDVGIFNATPGYFWQLYLHTENCGGMALDYWESSNSTIGSVSWTNSTGGTVAARIWAGANDMSCDLTYDLTVGVF